MIFGGEYDDDGKKIVVDVGESEIKHPQNRIIYINNIKIKFLCYS